MAGLAKQLWVIIPNQVVAGQNSKDIGDYMVQRHGIFVLLKPPLSKLTLLPFATPFLALLIGFPAAGLARRNHNAGSAPLDEAQSTPLKELLEP